MSVSFLRWEVDELGTPQAIFREGKRFVAFSLAELSGPQDHLANEAWIAAVMKALVARLQSLRILPSAVTS